MKSAPTEGAPPTGRENGGGNTSIGSMSFLTVSGLVSATQAIFESISKEASDPDQSVMFEKLADTWKSLN